LTEYTRTAFTPSCSRYGISLVQLAAEERGSKKDELDYQQRVSRVR
jgi:putative component of membrane protein insertase Oxa1/YidC/SpoIIIJ protein YidD